MIPENPDSDWECIEAPEETAEGAEEEGWTLISLEPPPAGLLSQATKSLNSTAVSTWKGFLITDWVAVIRDATVAAGIKQVFLSPMLAVGLSQLFSFWCSDQTSRKSSALQKANIKLSERLKATQEELEQLQRAVMKALPSGEIDEVVVKQDGSIEYHRHAQVDALSVREDAKTNLEPSKSAAKI